MPELVILNGVRAGAVFPLPDIPTILGRSPEAHLQIEDPWISSMHAMFERRGGELWVVDLDSRNGTFVGEERVAESRVTPGMALRFGRTEVRVDARVDARASTPPPVAEEARRGPRTRSEPQRATLRSDQTAGTGLPRVVREPEEEDPAVLTRRSAVILRIALHARAGAPVAVADLRAALDAAARAALKEGGVAVRLAGAGVLALFGLDAATPDDAAGALRAARAARAEVRALGGEVELRAAVDRGPLLTGNLAAPNGLELAALGEVADRVERLLALAAPGEILAGPGAAGAVGMAELGARELRRVGSEELEVVRVDAE